MLTIKGSRIRVVSDLHLGHDACQIREMVHLAPLFEEVDALILNGDASEQLADCFRGRGAQMREQFLGMGRERGVEVIELGGNHDPFLKGPRSLSLMNGEILIHHGDGVLRRVSPWSREIWHNRKWIRDYERANWRDDFDLQERLEFAAELARGLPRSAIPRSNNRYFRALKLLGWPPHRPLWILAIWAGLGSLLHRFRCRYAKDASLQICGHFHRSLSYEFEGGRSCGLVTGPFVALGRPSCVDLDLSEKVAELRAIELGDGPIRFTRSLKRLQFTRSGQWRSAAG